MTDLTAIDILIKPDEATLERARAVNARLRESVPTGYSPLDWGIPGQGYTAFVVQPSPQVLDFQAALIAPVGPYVGSGGTASAFVTEPFEPFAVHPASIAVYHLGNNGNARTQLKAWPLTS